MINYTKTFLNKLHWYFDLYIRFFLYNDRKRIRYHRYMIDKWGDLYTKKHT